MQKLTNKENRSYIKTGSFIENAWYVVILCGIIFAYHMGAHF